MATIDAIPGWQIQQFDAAVMMRLQAEGGRLRSLVTYKSGYRGIQAATVNYLGPTEAQRIIERKGPSPTANLNHERRWVTPVGYEWGDLVDTNDELFTNISPTGMYTEQGVKAMQRAEDREIISQFWGTTKTGETGSTNEAWVADLNGDVVYTVGVNVGGTNSGLNRAKLVALRKIFQKYYVDLDTMGPINMIITEIEEEDLLSDSTLLSRDFVSQYVIGSGKLPPLYGFNFILWSSQFLETVTDTALVTSHTRSLPVWVKAGMHLGAWQDRTTTIQPDPSFKFMPRIYMKSHFGAARLEPGKVLKCQVYH